jgi:hypothetical protein
MMQSRALYSFPERGNPLTTQYIRHRDLSYHTLNLWSLFNDDACTVLELNQSWGPQAQILFKYFLWLSQTPDSHYSPSNIPFSLPLDQSDHYPMNVSKCTQKHSDSGADDVRLCSCRQTLHWHKNCTTTTQHHSHKLTDVTWQWR